MREQGDLEHASTGSRNHSISNTELNGVAELSTKEGVKSREAYGVVRFSLLLLMQDLVALKAGVPMPAAAKPVAVILVAVDMVSFLGRSGGARRVAKKAVSRARFRRGIIVTVTIAGAGGEKQHSDTPAILHEKIGRMEVTFIIWATHIQGEAASKTEEAFMAAIGCRLVAGYWCLLARCLPISRVHSLTDN